MAVYRTKKEYLLFCVFIFIALYSYYKTTSYKFETSALQQQLDHLTATISQNHETKLHEGNALMTQDHKVNELKEGLSSLGEETKGLADKVPHLESVVSYLTSKVHEERMRYNETITNVEKTFSGLMNKIGALEGVINELHQHHELHEADHDNKEKEHAELHQKSKKELAEELMSKLRDHEEVEHGHGQNNGLVGLGRGTTEEEESSSSGSSGDDVSTVLLIVASPIRPDYLKKSLTYIANYHPKTSVPIMVSEDGESPEVDAVVKEMFDKMRGVGITVPLVHVHHPRHQEFAENGYFKLSRHFKWALTELFSHPLASGIDLPKRVIILEEDLQIAPDFFEFFAAVAPLVDSDDTVLAASAWNDNGVKGYVHDAEALYRSDFFPGLGWMISSKLWQELGPIWPNAYWDDWLREPLRRKGRHIIRPEICRTFHYGKKGVSNNQYSKFLDDIQLNEQFVPFKSMDLSYLESGRWEREYTGIVLGARVVDAKNIDNHASRGSLQGVSADVTEVTVFYRDLREFEKLAKQFGVMDNIKANVPRTAYHGVVSFWQKDTNPSRKVHLAPVGLAQTLVKTTITSNTDYDQSSSSKKRSFLRPRIQY